MSEKSVKLKQPSYCKDDECHAVRCTQGSEIILADRSAALYGRDRVELCGNHYKIHCDS